VDLNEVYKTLMDKYQHYEMVQLKDYDEMLVQIHKKSDALIQLDYQNHDHQDYY
jgi:hypothetical protein